MECGFSVDETVKIDGLDNFLSFKIDFVGKNLEGGRFAGENLENANFSVANLKGVDFSGANLRGVDFSGADLSVPICAAQTLPERCFPARSSSARI